MTFYKINSRWFVVYNWCSFSIRYCLKVLWKPTRKYPQMQNKVQQFNFKDDSYDSDTVPLMTSHLWLSIVHCVLFPCDQLYIILGCVHGDMRRIYNSSFGHIVTSPIFNIVLLFLPNNIKMPLSSFSLVRFTVHQYGM